MEENLKMDMKQMADLQTISDWLSVRVAEIKRDSILTCLNEKPNVLVLFGGAPEAGMDAFAELMKMFPLVHCSLPQEAETFNAALKKSMVSRQICWKQKAPTAAATSQT